MNVTPISFTGINVKIPSNDPKNQAVKFLYNRVLSKVNELQLPAMFHTDEIVVSVSDPKLEIDKISKYIKFLRKLKIEFNVD